MGWAYNPFGDRIWVWEPTRSAGEFLNVFDHFKRTGVVLSSRPEEPREPPTSVGVTARTANNPRQMVYGYTRVSGTLSFITTDVDAGGEFLHLVTTISGHEIQEVEKLFLNDEEVTLPNDPIWGWSTGDWGTPASKVFLSSSLGSTTQVANADLVSQSSILFPGKWVADHRQRGCAHVYLILLFDGDKFADGFPDIEFEVRGNNQIYDPRGTPSTGYSANAALIINNYLTTPRNQGGVGADYATEVNEEALKTAADICDESVSLSGGGSESRYEINGTFDLSQPPRSVLQSMAQSIAGDIVFENGLWSIYPGEYRTPSITLTTGDLRGSMDVQTRISRGSSFNAVKGQYRSATNAYEVTEYPAITNLTYETEDGEQIIQDIDFAFTTSEAMAQRIAKIELERVRQPITIEATFSMKAFQLGVTDTVQLTFADLGWTNKVFEVRRTELVGTQASSGVPELAVRLLLRETASGIFAWSAEETTVDLAPNTNLPSATNVVAPTGLTLTSGTNELYLRGDGTVFSRIKVAWTQPLDPFVKNGGSVEIQYKQSIDATFQPATIVPGDSTFAHVLDVQDGQNYDVRIRSVNGLGIKSGWVQELFHTVVGKTEAPNNVTSFSAAVGAFGIRFTWDAVVDLDIAYYEIRRGSTWATATHVSEVRGTSYTLDTQAAASYTHLIKAFDTSGNESATAASVATVISAPDAPVLSFAIEGVNVVLNWNAPTSQFAVEDYEVSYGSSAGDTIVATVKGTKYTFKAEWSGDRIFWIRATDVQGNVGSGGSQTISVASPSIVQNLIADVVDNNVLLDWDAPATGTLPVDSYKLYRGDVFSTATLLGNLSGTFAQRLELVAGNFNYWVTARDSAGNEGPQTNVLAVVSQPPDFVLQDSTILNPSQIDTLTYAIVIEC